MGDSVANDDGCSGIGLALDVVEPPNVAAVILVVVVEPVGGRDEASIADGDPVVIAEGVPAAEAAVAACEVPATAAPASV